MTDVIRQHQEPFALEGLIIDAEPEFMERLKDVAFGPAEFRFLRSLKDSRDLEYVLSNNRLGRGEGLKLLYFLNLVGFMDIKIKESVSNGSGQSANMEGLTQQS